MKDILLKKEDQISLSELYDKYAPAVYGRILIVISNKRVAEMILVQVFINVWNKRSQNTNQLSDLINLLNEARNISYEKLKSMKSINANSRGKLTL